MNSLAWFIMKIIQWKKKPLIQFLTFHSYTRFKLQAFRACQFFTLFIRFPFKILRKFTFLRTALFWAITQPLVAIPYRRCGTNYWAQLQGSRIQKQIRNQPKNQPTKQLTEGRDLHKSASRRLSTSLTIPALTTSLGSITDTLNCNCNCAYVNEFPVAVEDLEVDKLRTIPQGAIDLMRGYKLFGSQLGV